MRITIDIDKTQPLTGIASSEGKTSVSFVGWMSLLRAISELTETMEQAEDAERHADGRAQLQMLGSGNSS